MRIHILGIGGTFMSGLALLAKQRGDQVSGSDLHLYPPMSTQLAEQGIQWHEGYDAKHIPDDVDCVIVGNVIKRGNPAMEYIMAQNIPYQSGPAWLAEHVLSHRHVLAVSGTHGKTTTTSMLMWMLQVADLKPGFLIGGIPENVPCSAQLGEGKHFVIEADEYDTAFFDKRPKFMHYRPRTLILNNLEYDHADIYPNLAAIAQQFHYLLRTVPNNGLVVHNASEPALTQVVSECNYTPYASFNDDEADWQARLLSPDGHAFRVLFRGSTVGEVRWNLFGMHNVNNALAAIAAAHHIGVAPDLAAHALSSFKGVKRRMEVKASFNGITFYDDFAHHPTAIATTLSGLQKRMNGSGRLVLVVGFNSYTMRTGVHLPHLKQAFSYADVIVCQKPEIEWGLTEILQTLAQKNYCLDTKEQLLACLLEVVRPGDHVIMMSNTGFDGLEQKIVEQLTFRYTEA